MLWLELPDGFVVWSELVEPGRPFAAADSFARAMARPLVGPPRRPKRVRVSDHTSAAELRAAHPDLALLVAPTPELDAVLAEMARGLPTTTDESYLEDGRIPEDAIARLFQAAEILWRVAPWRTANDSQVLRVDVPAFGVEGACLSVVGALGQTLGFLLFPSVVAFESFLRAAEDRRTERLDLGTSMLSLELVRAADLPPSKRREVTQHGWPVAAREAYPRLEHRDRDGVLRPLSEDDVRIAAAVATSPASFCIKHGDVLGKDEIEPICESWYDQDDTEVRFTVPYEAAAMFTIEEPPWRRPEPAQPRVGRNAPCPCGSGKKFKKCCLPREETSAGVSAGIHDLDQRLVSEMRRFAARRFGESWMASDDAFFDPAEAIQLSAPWSVYGFHVDGRAVVDWFLAQPGRRLAPGERAWLEAQRQAWMGVWEVTEVDPGHGMTVRDLLSGEERRVEEVRGSRTLVARDTILGRIVDHENVSVMCAAHPRPLPPLDAAEVLRRARGRLRRRTAVPVERLRDQSFGRYLIARWEDAVADLDARHLIPSQLHNTDGDPLLLTTDHFTFDPASRPLLISRLASIDGLAEPDEIGRESCFAMLREGNAIDPAMETTVLGRVRVGEAGLKLETNSLRRADALRRTIESACGDVLHHRAREHSDPLSPAAGAGASTPAPPTSPEILQYLRGYKERHYAQWIDQPLPALNGRSPRDTVRTRAGRERVDVLLRDMENQEARLPAGERFDFARIRAALGLQ